jgi:(p)ppGpp synthase/HD superfamily hydrolase
MYGPRFEAALGYASALHHGQRRKGSGAPYITHPLAVAAIVGQYGGDEDQAIAALLHDVIEDCGVTREAIAARYGERVAAIVDACTDTDQQPKPPWRPRKEAHLAHVRSQPPEVKLVVCADKLHNAQCIATDLRRPSVGHAVWSRFRASRDDVLWYYQSMVEALGHEWAHELHDELRHVVGAMTRRSKPADS